MDILYRLHALSKSFNGREVLNIPELTLKRGVIYALLGPNGSGKTTLMRLLAFMDTPTRGSIEFMGSPVKPEQDARCRARVVWAPQYPVMFTGTLLYNIEYPLRIKGMAHAKRTEKALELLELVHLTHLAKSPARRLSGGEMQRASIARALAAGAQVILFDEPTASVDFRSRNEIISLILQINRERGLSLVVTTHDADLAAEVCKEKIILFDGHIVPRYPQSGRKRFSDPYGVAAIPGRLIREGDAFHVALPSDALPESGPTGAPARLAGIREEEDGILLHLITPSGFEVTTVLTAGQDSARSLTLGKELLLASNHPRRKLPPLNSFL